VPLVKSLGSKLGAVLFQFSPLGHRVTRHPETFVARLGEFLSGVAAGNGVPRLSCATRKSSVHSMRTRSPGKWEPCIARRPFAHAARRQSGARRWDGAFDHPLDAAARG